MRHRPRSSPACPRRHHADPAADCDRRLRREQRLAALVYTSRPDRTSRSSAARPRHPPAMERLDDARSTARVQRAPRRGSTPLRPIFQGRSARSTGRGRPPPHHGDPARCHEPRRRPPPGSRRCRSRRGGYCQGRTGMPDLRPHGRPRALPVPGMWRSPMPGMRSMPMPVDPRSASFWQAWPGRLWYCGDSRSMPLDRVMTIVPPAEQGSPP